MNAADNDLGLLSVLLERLEKQRLPHALALKEKVDNGGTLDDYDIDFFKEVFADAANVGPLIQRHPEYVELAGKITHLYQEIMEKALLNQKCSVSS